MKVNSGCNGAFLRSSLRPAQLRAGCRPQPCLESWGPGRGTLKFPPQRCPGSRHALWPSGVDLKSVRPGVPVRLGRQQYLLINLFIDLLGCTWGFSREELQTCGPPSSQPSVSFKLGLKMPQGLEQAGREQLRSPGSRAGRAVGHRGTWEPGRGAEASGRGGGPATRHARDRGCGVVSEGRALHRREVAPLH